MNEPVDPAMVAAWLTARSIARGVPPPVRDWGGLRVDSGTADEVRRWVFARRTAGLAELGRTIMAPRHFLKLCGDPDDLRAALPDTWRIGEPAFFMQAGRRPADPIMPAGYRIAVGEVAGFATLRVHAEDGTLAASGYAVETRHAFVYDRIVTEPDHRRRGLGRAVMGALRSTKRVAGTPELLVATADGRALYATLGWTTLSPYASASIPDPA